MNGITTTDDANPWPAWAEMWAIALVIYLALKLLTWIESGGWRAPSWLSAGYLVAWPGMDARRFLFDRSEQRGCRAAEWVFASIKLAFGLALLGLCSVIVLPWLRSWVGLAAIAFLLHFGVFHLLSCAWRSVGISAVPLMDWPVGSTSVSEFWGRRWNRAFRDLTHRFLFRPLQPRIGAVGALWVGFVISGLVHDAVISIPARAGLGLPTLYFLLQAFGIMLERSKFGKSLGLGRGASGWLFGVLVVLLPSPLLFHAAFIERVILPFLNVVQAATVGLLR